MAKKFLRTVVKNPGEPAKMVMMPIERGSAWLTAAVGGLIEGIHLRELGMDGYANEEGLIIGLDINLAVPDYDLLVGPVVITGHVNSRGEDTGLTPAEVEAAIAYLDSHAATLKDVAPFFG